MKTKRAALIDVAVLFLLATALVWPLFRTTYFDRWESIESAYITDARYVNAHGALPRWQPLWYAGTRFGYVYPPAPAHGVAAMARVLGVPEARAYHIWSALFSALGIAGVYVLVLTLSGGARGLAWMAAVAAALVSPSFLFLPEIRHTAGQWLVPQRLGVLLRYGEGPHIASFSILAWALAAAWCALERSRPAMLALAAGLTALVVATNFYGACALALLFPILAYSAWVVGRDARVWARGAGIAAIAAGLSAFWLTPSYVRLTLANLSIVSQPGHAWSAGALAGTAAAFAALSLKRKNGYRVFVWGSAAALSLIVLGWRYWDLRVLGEPVRFVPELDLALTLAALEIVRWLWTRRVRAARVLAALVVLFALWTSRKYVRHAWQIMPPDAHPEQRVEYQLPHWTAANLPGARAFAAGSVRFWYDLWDDLPQVGGGSDQGITNPVVLPAQAEVLLGRDAKPAIEWMQALGVDAVIVSGSRSREIYHDWKFPLKFRGVLPVLYDNGQDDVIYRVPRRFPGRTRVVEAARVLAVRPPRGSTDFGAVHAYVEAIENGPAIEPTLTQTSPELMRIRAHLEPGHAILVQESYDPAWRATANGRPVAIAKDPFGFLLLQVPPGDQTIDLEFPLPLENRLGTLATGATLIILAGLLAAAARRRS